MSRVPTFNRLLIKKVEEARQGLIQLDNARSLFELGEVLAVGPLAGIRNEKRFHKFYVGQKVVYQKSQVSEIKLVNDSYLVISDDAVMVADPE